MSRRSRDELVSRPDDGTTVGRKGTNRLYLSDDHVHKDTRYLSTHHIVHISLGVGYHGQRIRIAHYRELGRGWALASDAAVCDGQRFISYVNNHLRPREFILDRHTNFCARGQFCNKNRKQPDEAGSLGNKRDCFFNDFCQGCRCSASRDPCFDSWHSCTFVYMLTA
jgi:hypothetical protein